MWNSISASTKLLKNVTVKRKKRKEKNSHKVSPYSVATVIQVSKTPRISSDLNWCYLHPLESRNPSCGCQSQRITACPPTVTIAAPESCKQLSSSIKRSSGLWRRGSCHLPSWGENHAYSYSYENKLPPLSVFQKTYGCVFWLWRHGKVLSACGRGLVSTFRKVLTNHFISYTLLAPGWTFGLQNCLKSWWQRSNKVPETFLKDFEPY